MLESRTLDDGTAIRRRRECAGCGRRFTTYERIEGEETLRVMKKDGRSEAFDRRKLVRGITIACEKRPVAGAAIEAAVNHVHQRLLATAEREVPASRIGALVMDELRGLDQVAYVRFASVYREFKDLEEFVGEVRRVLTAVPGVAAGPASPGPEQPPRGSER